MKELSLHILDVVQNSIAADASRVEVSIVEDSAADRLTITVADNGRGMSPELVRTVTDPFVTTRTTRRVGLGLPLMAETARRTGGDLTVTSAPGQGTTVTAVFGRSSIDRPPLGDIASTIACLLAANPNLDLGYRHAVDGREWACRAEEFRRHLGEVSLAHPAVFTFIREYLAGALAELSARADVVSW